MKNMRKSVNGLILLAALALTFSSCVSKKKFTELMNDKEGIAATLAETQKKVQDLETANSELEEAKTNLESENSKLNTELSSTKQNLDAKTREASEAKTMLSEKEAQVVAYEKGIKTMFASYEGTGLKVEQRDNRLYIIMDDPVMFRSGSTRVQRKYRDALTSLAEVLQNNPGLNIQVEGHTDNAKFVEGNGNNWNLSLNRAMNVVNMLLRKGANPNQLSAVGRGEHAPVATDDPSSSDARAKNRRVEFVVVPNLSDIYSVKP